MTRPLDLTGTQRAHRADHAVPTAGGSIPFAKADLTEREYESVEACLRSGWLTTGPRTREFEDAFLAYLGLEGTALAVNSATAGLHLALEAVGVGPGDEVIVPTHAFTATAEVVRYLGANPVLCDVEARTLNCSLETILPHVSPRTRAVIPVHFAGLAVDMDPIIRFARDRGIAVIEDAAHALPTTYHGQLVGALETDATVFSFYATKPLSTGEGGMLVTRDRKLAKRCAVMRLHGIDRDAFVRYRDAGGKWRYEVVAPGFKYNLTDIASALGIVQLSRLDEMARRRDEIATGYRSAFQNLPVMLPGTPRPGDRHSWHLFCVRLHAEAPLDRDAFIAGMAQRGIGCSVHWMPLHMHPYWKSTYQLTDHHFPIATAAFSRLVSLPIYSAMTSEEAARVEEVVCDLLGVT